MMTKPLLRAVSRTQGNNRALKDGLVRPQLCDLRFDEVKVLVDAFRRMVRGREFDVCEMALTTYLCAKECGARFTAIPVFLVRGFHHAAIVVNRDAGIRTPKDLEGREVGVNRGYTVTTGVWARAVLQEEYDVDLDAVVWRPSSDEHVAEYRAPGNVVPLGPGPDLASRVISGELPAAVGLQIDHPQVELLIPASDDAAETALLTRGHYPINHLVVVKDELLVDHPGLGIDLVEAFAESKQLYVDALLNGAIDEPSAADRTYRRVAELTGGDPLPYGIAPNRAVLDELIAHARRQHILSAWPDVDALFASGTRDLVV